MLAPLTTLDVAICGLAMAGTVLVGFYFSGRQLDSTEFLLAGRSLGWRPLAASLVAMLVPGLRTWVVPAAAWIVLPFSIWIMAPLYRGLGLSSIYEYLEERFDGRVRLAAGIAFFALRVTLVAGLIAGPTRAVLLAAGWTVVPAWWLALLIGGLATLVAFLGGMRSVVWYGAAAALAVAVAAVVLIGAAWLSIDGGPTRIAQIASALGRTDTTPPEFDWGDAWNLWAALPFWCLANLVLMTADQATTGRLLAAKDINVARTACLAATLGLTMLLPALLYLGVCLWAFYYDRPSELQPLWVTNIDGVTRQPIREANGRPLLDPANPAHEISAVTIEQLIAQRRILQPNNKEPFASSAGLIDAESNRVLVERLAMRRPPRGKLNGEFIVARDAPREMLPVFAAHQLPMGARGIVIVALLMATIAPLIAAVHGLTAWLMLDLHRRFGWLKSRLAHRLNKTPEQLTPADELRLARPFTFVAGALVTLLAALLARLTDPLPIVVLAMSTLAGPLLAVFLLGMLTRRATAAAALTALVLGTGSAVAFALLRPAMLAEAWNLVFSFTATLLAGYLLSFVLGRRRTNAELRGLVVGCGTLGLRPTSHPPLSTTASASVRTAGSPPA
jgi:solute carrier family 5 (sodium-dependent multivitamin transporter), member 6